MADGGQRVQAGELVMSFSIVAAARAKTYFFMELSFNIVF